MKKICKKCGRNRKIGKFGNQTKSLDGKNPYCRDCMREYNRRYKNSLIGRLKNEKAIRKWKENNKEKISIYNKEYYLKNKSRILYNKRAREETESVLIFDKPEKSKQNKINKNRVEYDIKINPKRKDDD